MNMYVRFGAMIATSTVVMFVLMYLNTYQWSHATFSETRTYMALLMGATMAAIMLGFMTHMLKDWRVNIGILVGSVAVFVLSLWLVRSQRTVEDVSYMNAMIPHHSIAIMTSERAELSDPRVRKLADNIIKAQRREIAEMQVLVEDIQTNGTQTAAHKSATKRVMAPKVPPPDASAVKVPDGFRAEVVVSGLTYPTSVEFDDIGTMYIAEAGYSYGDPAPKPRILSVAPDGTIETLVEGAPLVGPINDLLWYDGVMYVSHRGKISVLEKDKKVRDLVTGLPSDGDHHNNQMTVGPDGMIYFGQGTATNSGVVGEDSYKMGWLPDHRQFHDVPGHDIKLNGHTYETPNLFGEDKLTVVTSPFHPFAESSPEGTVVTGQTKASGTILRMKRDGSNLEVYAWGLRNPYGVMWSPQGVLYATENGFDDRGSRPIANDQEDIYVIKKDAWYGWPDYAMGIPVTDERFHAKGKAKPQFVMATHPAVEQPLLNFPKHSAITKADFSTGDPFGKGQMFVAFFGHMSPMTGEAPEEHGGHRVVKIDVATKKIETFLGKKESHGEQGHHEEQDESVSPGPRRLMDVRFSSDGQAMYIADFGSMVVKDKPVPVPGTGVIWRVVPQASPPASPPANLSVRQ